jgi:hypothetical protein
MAASIWLLHSGFGWLVVEVWMLRWTGRIDNLEYMAEAAIETTGTVIENSLSR